MRVTEFLKLEEDHPSDIDFDKAYKSFVGAEMTGVDAGKDGSGHYIRTYGANKKTDPEGYKKGSSAYGPVQINKGTAKDFTTRYPNKFKDIKRYTDKYDAQGANQLKYGREPNKHGYDAKYEYGGKGDLSTPEYHAPYQTMAKTMMRQMDHELKSNNPKAGIKDLIRRWRGKSNNEDQRYYDEFFKTYNQQK
jgi:autotransporter adhesin